VDFDLKSAGTRHSSARDRTCSSSRRRAEGARLQLCGDGCSKPRWLSQRNCPTGILSSSPEQVTAWFTGKVPFQFRLPVSGRAPNARPFYRLIGASLVAYQGSPAALVVYEARGEEKISLLVASNKSAVVAGGDEIQYGTQTFHYLSKAGFKIITWSNHGLSYALVSSISSSARGSCLVCHQNMPDRDGFTPGP
jgi:hypothetical protein